MEPKLKGFALSSQGEKQIIFSIELTFITFDPTRDTSRTNLILDEV